MKSNYQGNKYRYHIKEILKNGYPFEAKAASETHALPWPLLSPCCVVMFPHAFIITSRKKKSIERYLFTFSNFASPTVPSALSLSLPRHPPLILSSPLSLFFFLSFSPIKKTLFADPPPSPSVVCVSRTLTVTQIFWLLAAPLEWDVVSARH